MADPKSGAVNSQYKPETSFHTEKQRSYPHSQGLCQDRIGDKLKGLPLTKDKIVCASKYVIIIID